MITKNYKAICIETAALPERTYKLLSHFYYEYPCHKIMSKGYMLGCYQLVIVRKIRYVVCDSENTVAWFEHLTPTVNFSFSFKT